MSIVRQTRGIFGYPDSRSGRAAVTLIALALGVGGFVATSSLLVSGLVGSEAMLEARWLAISLAALALCGVLAAIAALVAFVVEEERSLFVAVAFFVGLVITHAAINGL